MHDIRGCRCLILIRYDHDNSEVHNISSIGCVNVSVCNLQSLMLCLSFLGEGSIEKTLPQSKILGVFGMNYFVIPDEFSSIRPITWVQLEAACTALDMKFWWKKTIGNG